MTSAPEPAPDFAASIAYVIHQETLGGAACGWDHCSGCYDTEDGRPTGHYPHSDIFGCEVGSGCSECGGLGVVWSHYSKDELEDMACEVSAPAMSALSHPEPVAQEPVAYASAGQIGSLDDRPGDEGGVYIPLRKTPIGNFQMPLYATPPDGDAVRALREALEKIERWFGEFPETGEFWDAEKTRPISYGAQYGSNGERDYMRDVARATLSNQGSSSNGQ